MHFEAIARYDPTCSLARLGCADVSVSRSWDSPAETALKLGAVQERARLRTLLTRRGR
jgi:hypothetical protein